MELQSRVPEEQKALIANALSGSKELSKFSAQYLERRTRIIVNEDDPMRF